MAVLKRCAGLVTFHNELLKTEGALEIADNVIIDADDTIEIRNGFGDFGAAFSTSSTRLKQVLEYKDRILRHYNDILEFDSTGNGDFLPFNGLYNELDSGLRIKAIETKSNLYFTTDEGIKRISAKTASDFTTTSGFIENAGISKATDLSVSLKFASGGFLPPESKCAYRFLWGKRDNNNNLLLGAPSGREILINNSFDSNIPEQFTIDFSAGATETNVAGKYIIFSSLNSDYFLWFKNTANPSKPETAETISRIAIEADVDGLAASTSTIVSVAANALGALSEAFTIEVSGDTIVVTSKEKGDLSNAAEQSGGITNVNINIDSEGSIIDGSSANSNVTLTVPVGINSADYFYQVYRTAPITVTEGITLDDLDPGDEMNLVYEANVTSAEILSGTVQFEDITTEDFRASAAFLYTNPNTGDGITQANDIPPLAKDLALFRNSVFYSNTKSTHRQTINLLAVSSFTSGVSSLVIGNEDGQREYTFVGVTEEYDIVTDTKANTTADSVILLNSAGNERKYYVWLDKGAGTDPAIANRERIRVDISGATSAADVASALATELEDHDDFIASAVGSTVSVDLAKNGDTTDPIFGSPAPGGAWSITVTTQGDGEDTSSQDILLSSLASAGQAIDETARSMIRVINRDPSSPVNAIYQSGPDDLPGIILLESRTLEDKPFYVAVNDDNIKSKFDPEMPTTETITAISLANPTQITSAAHGLVTGDKVYIYGTNSTPALLGQYTVTVVNINDFTVPVNVTVAGTSGIWFKTTIESDNDESPNRIYYSKFSQPEAVPLVNFIDVGAQDKKIQRILALRDSLFALKEDGVYVITGTSAPNFASRLLDNTIKIQSPDTAVVLNNQIFALSSEGVVTITESGVRLISRPIENLIDGILRIRDNSKTLAFGVNYDSEKAYLLWGPTTSNDTVATQCFRYHTVTDTWTRWTKEATCGILHEEQDVVYIGSGTRNVTEKERKTNSRKDKADRDFALSIPSNSVEESKVTPSNTANITIGDVLVQTQYVTIAQINRLLKKLDIDPGLDDSDYFSTLEAKSGDNLNDVLTLLNAKLVADDSSGIVTARIFSSVFTTMQDQYNDLIGELNTSGSDAQYSNYKESEGTVMYEGLIIVKNNDGSVTLNSALPLISGDITIFKGIKARVQWAPQDFGAADMLKQIREGSMLFDQNNFYSATISFATDLSQNFDEHNFFGRGVGDWGMDNWGESIWGGEGSEVPLRTLIPREKQRCRFIRVRFDHINGRENVRIIGISFIPRQLSTRAYR